MSFCLLGPRIIDKLQTKRRLADYYERKQEEERQRRLEEERKKREEEERRKEAERARWNAEQEARIKREDAYLEEYKATLAEGPISQRERDYLARVCSRLGIPADRAAILEQSIWEPKERTYMDEFRILMKEGGVGTRERAHLDRMMNDLGLGCDRVKEIENFVLLNETEMVEAASEAVETTEVFAEGNSDNKPTGDADEKLDLEAVDRELDTLLSCFAGAGSRPDIPRDSVLKHLHNIKIVMGGEGFLSDILVSNLAIIAFREGLGDLNMEELYSSPYSQSPSLFQIDAADDVKQQCFDDAVTVFMACHPSPSVQESILMRLYNYASVLGISKDRATEVIREAIDAEKRSM